LRCEGAGGELHADGELGEGGHVNHGDDEPRTSAGNSSANESSQKSMGTAASLTKMP